jgi:predicted  nucleic acid-binding Zn-ribbon protein
MKKSTEEIGQLMDYEKLSAIHLLELPKIKKQDIPSYIRCPKYDKAINNLNQKMERYQSKVDRLEDDMKQNKQNIAEMERDWESWHRKANPLFLDREDINAVERQNQAAANANRLLDKISNAKEKQNDLIDKHTEAVEEANEKLKELTDEALLVIDEDIVTVFDRCTKIAGKLEASQNIDDLIEAIEICLIELRIFAMFEDMIEGNDERKDCRERMAEVNQKFAALCVNELVLKYFVDMYQRNLSQVEKNIEIHQQVVQVVGSVDQEQLTTQTQSTDAVLAEKINTEFKYEGVIDPAELDAIVTQINKTIDALKQNIAKANEVTAASGEFAGTGVSANQQAETLLASMKSNVETLADDILIRSHFASQMIEEEVLENFYNKELRAAVTGLRQQLVGTIGKEKFDGMMSSGEDRFSLEKAHSRIKEANLVRLKTALDKLPEHIKKMTDLIAAAESDIKKANDVPRQNADALDAELGKKYIGGCFPVLGCITAFGILGRVKTFESAFRSTNQIYRDLGNALLVKNKKMTTVVMVIGAILGFGGMAAFFVLNLGHSVGVNAGVPGAVLVLYIITTLLLTLVGKRLSSFLGVSAEKEIREIGTGDK